jgi:predicted N-acyltransferase
MQTRQLTRIDEVGASEWNELAGDYPFLRHEFLRPTVDIATLLFSASRASMITIAAALSESCEALPAVTVRPA